MCKIIVKVVCLAKCDKKLQNSTHRQMLHQLGQKPTQNPGTLVKLSVDENVGRMFYISKLLRTQWNKILKLSNLGPINLACHSTT